MAAKTATKYSSLAGGASLALNSRLSHAALRWLAVLLSERFGHEWCLEYVGDDLQLRLQGAVGCIGFPSNTHGHHVGLGLADSCSNWSPQDEGLPFNAASPLPAPGVSSLPRPLIERGNAGANIRYNLIEVIYGILTRVEELNSAASDLHARFPATASHAYRHGYLGRPIVDEWLAILALIIVKEWPGITLRKHSYRVELSHDVDHPSRYLFGSLQAVMRSALGDLVKRRDLFAPIRAIRVRRLARNSLHDADLFNTFEWIMDKSDSYSVKSTFYFMAGRTRPGFDVRYSIGHPAIRSLMRRIHQRGHLIGLHPSYECFLDADQIRREAEALWTVCEEEKIRQSEWGARMHFLRWKCPRTVTALSAAGLTHDATLGYADRIGFRCGTAFSYPFFDHVSQSTLPLRVRPLLAMDVSIYGKAYNNLGLGQEARSSISTIINNVHLVNGTFTLLWHNSELNESRKKQLYCYALQEAFAIA